MEDELNQKKFDWRTWLKGLFATVVSGVSSAGSAYMGMAIADVAGLEVPKMNFNALGIICLTSGIVSLFAYLKQSPIPPEVSE